MTAVPAPSSAPTAQPSVGRQVPGRSQRCILVVDDEPVVLAVTTRILADAGYLAVEAPNAREALRVLELGDQPIDLVITDVVMPETDGHALGRLIAERYPGLPVVYMSAYPARDVFHRGPPEASAPFLLKPFSAEALAALVRDLLAGNAVTSGRSPTCEHADRGHILTSPPQQS
jgi:two-component system, cell cycle sensor histidine kinase and response regulator CckA